MIRGAPEGGLVFFSPPNRQQRLSRRRLRGAAVILGLVLAGALIGGVSSLIHGVGTMPGPLSYLSQ
jgi:hypothetical protein